MPDINAFYNWAIQKCNEPNVGYSQTYRNQRTVGGITYYDCSSFINYALLAGGWETPSYAPNYNAFTTYNMVGVLLSLGWVDVTDTGEYKAGDIGWNPTHTEICYEGGNGDGIFMGAHTDEVPLANQVSIGGSNGDATARRSFSRIYRYGNGATGRSASLYVISAICGNFWRESHIDPAVWEGLRVGDWHELYHGYGLGQWTNTGDDPNGRLWKLYQWMTSKGYSMDDGDGQLEYLIYENTWYRTAEASEYESLTDFLASTSTDIEALTHAYNIGWEGIHDESWDLRVTYANMIYEYLSNPDNLTGNKQWITGNRYLQQDEILHNSVLVYRFFHSGGGVIPDTPSTLKNRRLPVWMMIRYHW